MRFPVNGIGLVRMEFLIARHARFHPLVVRLIQRIP